MSRLDRGQLRLVNFAYWFLFGPDRSFISTSLLLLSFIYQPQFIENLLLPTKQFWLPADLYGSSTPRIRFCKLTLIQIKFMVNDTFVKMFEQSCLFYLLWANQALFCIGFLHIERREWKEAEDTFNELQQETSKKNDVYAMLAKAIIPLNSLYNSKRKVNLQQHTKRILAESKIWISSHRAALDSRSTKCLHEFSIIIYLFLISPSFKLHDARYCFTWLLSAKFFTICMFLAFNAPFLDRIWIIPNVNFHPKGFRLLQNLLHLMTIANTLSLINHSLLFPFLNIL